jgi:hypothetical protein
MPESVVVTSPPTHTSGNVAQAKATAQRCGHGELSDLKLSICIFCSGIRENSAMS